MFGNPVNVFIEFHHAISELCDFDKPARHCAINQWLRATPTMWIRVVVRVVANDSPFIFELTNDQWVCIKNMCSDPCGNEFGIATLVVHRANGGNPCTGTYQLVIFTESGGKVHHTGSIFSRYKVCGEHLECIFRIGEEGEKWRVLTSCQLASLDCGYLLSVNEFLFIGTKPRLGQNVFHAFSILHDCVIDIGTYRQRKVRWQGPRCCGPGHDAFTRLEQEPHRQRRVLTILIHIVHSGFRIR